MGWFNTIWQQDANAMVLQAFSQPAVPPRILNLTGRDILRVRDVAEKLATRMGTKVTFTGKEGSSALLNNAKKAHVLYGPPQVGIEQLVEWVADWTRRGGESLGKPTHFASRDGRL